MSDYPRSEHKQVLRGGGGRTIKQRPVTFQCQWCGQLVTELRYPSPTPVYGLACKTEALRYAEAAKKARQRQTEPPEQRRTTTCWDSPTNLLTYGYIDPKAEELARAAIVAREEQGRINTALEARSIVRMDEDVRRFLEECGL